MSKTDNCPEWADKLIVQLRDQEIELGNIVKKEDWKVQKIVDLNSDPTEQQEITESSVEILFIKVAQALSQKGFKDTEIVEFINTRITPDSTPKYCNEAEIKEALQQKIQ